VLSCPISPGLSTSKYDNTGSRKEKAFSLLNNLEVSHPYQNTKKIWLCETPAVRYREKKEEIPQQNYAQNRIPTNFSSLKREGKHNI